VKPSFETYIQPNKKYADVIIPRGADNLVAINLLSKRDGERGEEEERTEGEQERERGRD
jgi:hypothetical protein